MYRNKKKYKLGANKKGKTERVQIMRLVLKNTSISIDKSFPNTLENEGNTLGARKGTHVSTQANKT